ncbi:MAG: SDR family oxidoreductase [Marinifilaceae bacterium]
MKKILLLGANGFIGRRVLLALCNEFEMFAVSANADICPSTNYTFMQCDMQNITAMEQLLHHINPDIIINTAAVSSPDFCEQNKDIATAINVDAVKVMADYSEAHNVRVLHLSTDFVFDGLKKELYTEQDATGPVNFYGVTKDESEKYLLSKLSNAAVIRVEVVYGNVFAGQHSNIVLLVKQRLQAGQTIRVVNDQFRTPTFVNDVVDGIVRILKNEASGIYHICGKELMSIAQLAYGVADFWNLDSTLIEPVSTQEMKEATPRPQYSGMSIAKASRDLGYEPHSFVESLQLMV